MMNDNFKKDDVITHRAEVVEGKCFVDIVDDCLYSNNLH